MDNLIAIVWFGIAATSAAALLSIADPNSKLTTRTIKHVVKDPLDNSILLNPVTLEIGRRIKIRMRVNKWNRDRFFRNNLSGFSNLRKPSIYFSNRRYIVDVGSGFVFMDHIQLYDLFRNPDFMLMLASE